MTIDIIDLNDPQYADLSAVQMAMVRTAQEEKNRIVAKAESEKQDLFLHLLINDNARTSAWERETSAIDGKAAEDVDAVRETLLYQLAYEAIGQEGNEQGPYRYPENPNYGLSYSQRFLVVRNYYMQVTDDPAARLEAYRMDSLARSYLGDYYATLYDLLASYTS